MTLFIMCQFFLNLDLKNIISYQDPEDLPFRKSEVLDVISKDEKDWWTCRNSRGNVGQVPVPYVSKVSMIKNKGKVWGRITEKICIRSQYQYLKVVEKVGGKN